MHWWHWLVIGLILVALEMAASGGFYVIFFGIAALAIAGLHVLDWAGPVWVQLVLFSTISVVSLLVFRGPLLRWMKLDQPGKDIDSLVGVRGQHQGAETLQALAGQLSPCQARQLLPQGAGDLVQKRFVPGDQQAGARRMLRLSDHLGGQELRVGGGVGQDDDLAGPGDAIDADGVRT